MGKAKTKAIKRNERNKDVSEIEKLEKEYDEPTFAIESTRPIGESEIIKELKETADKLSDPVVKEQLESIVTGTSIVGGKELAPASGFVTVEKSAAPTEETVEKQLESDSIIYREPKSGDFDNPATGADAEEKIIKGNVENKAVGEVNEELLEKLNKAAETLLKCLPDEMAKDFRTACFKDHSMKDMGIYLMGLLNRLYKVGDYYNPDIEPEWDKRVVGYSSELYCNNCNKLIENPTNLNQLFCSNVCSKNYKERYSTGVIKPAEKEHPTEEEQDQKAWDNEL